MTGAGPAECRELWERAGVLADAVSSTVLTLGLRPVASDPRTARLRAAAQLGDPAHLSAWDVRRTPLELDAGVPVLVCENPAVLKAFAVLCGGAYPVVCTAGWMRRCAPKAHRLARCGDLRVAGGPLRRRAVADNRERLPRRARGAPLKGREVSTSWEPGLATAMRERGPAVYEEQVVQELLAAWPGS